MKDDKNFVSVAILEFRKLKKWADRAVSQVSQEQFFYSETDGDNSIALICKHVSGNMISRWTDFLTADGEKPNRNRDLEFEILGTDDYDALLSKWEEGWSVLFASLEALTPGDLGRTVQIRGEGLSVLQAISRQHTHYAYHVGQIVFVAKQMTKSNWVSLSIPKGKSVEFNNAPSKYLSDEG